MTKQIICPVCNGKGFVFWINTTENTNSTGSKTCPHCNGTGMREVALTNADKVSSEPYKELTKLFDRIGYSCVYPDEECAEEGNCKSCWAKWLQQPVEN